MDPYSLAKELRGMSANYDPVSIIDLISKSLFITLLKSTPCTICQSTVEVEMHHIKAIRKMSYNTKANYSQALMSRMNRRQIPLCKTMPY